MALSSSSKLNIAELIIYAILAPLTIFLARRHGRHGLLGYFYLNAYCMIRVVANIIELLPGNRDPSSGHISTSQAVLSAVGLSPLILALGGFLHEAHVYLVHITSHGRHQEIKTKRWLWVIQLQIHAVCWTAMALIIAGSVGLVDSKDGKSQRSRDITLRKVGVVLLLLLLGTLSLYALFLTLLARRAVPSARLLKSLLGAIVVSIPFVGIRDIYAVISIFDSSDNSLNPVTGILPVKVIFVVLAPMLAVGAWCVGGWMSRNVADAILISQPVRTSLQPALLAGASRTSGSMEEQTYREKQARHGSEQVSPWFA
jgi:hypothetical protein